MQLRNSGLMIMLIAGIWATSSAASALTVNIDAGSQGTLDPNAGSESIFLTAGTYNATMVDGLNDGDPATLHTGWSFRSGDPATWLTAYRITLADNSFILGGFGNGSTAFDSAAEAFAQTPQRTLVFDVPTDQTVRFHLTDQAGGAADNRGGISLGVVVPEPMTGSLLLLGLAAAVVRQRRGPSFECRSCRNTEQP